MTLDTLKTDSTIFSALAIIILLTVGISTGASAQEMKIDSNAVTWLKFDMPPSWIVSGIHKNKGVIDSNRAVMQRGLSDYTHQEITVSFARFTDLMGSSKRIYCNAAWLDFPGERERLHFSKWVFYTAPNHALMLKTTYDKYFQGENAISIERAIIDKGLRVGFFKDRPYGGTVNKLINDNKDNPLVRMLTSSNQFSGMNMIQSDRLDIMLDYPTMATYINAEKSSVSPSEEELMVKPVEENIDYYPYYAVCNKAKGSDIIITKINGIIDNHFRDLAFRRGTLRWYPEKIYDEWFNINFFKKTRD